MKEEKAEDLYFKHKKGCSECDDRLPLKTFLEIVETLLQANHQKDIEKIEGKLLKIGIENEDGTITFAYNELLNTLKDRNG